MDPVVSQALTTLVAGFIATVIAVGCALAITLGCRYVAGLHKAFSPMAVVFYSLPPFVLLLLIKHLTPLGENVVLLTVLMTLYPIHHMVSKVLEYSTRLASYLPVGTFWAKLRQVLVPVTTHGILETIKTCCPWIILATLLSEIAISNQDGLGQNLNNAIGYGLAEAYPLIAAAGAISVFPYVMLDVLTRWMRHRYALNELPENGDTDPAVNRYRWPSELLLLLVVFGSFWLLINLSAELIAPGPLQLATRVQGNVGGILTSLFYTLFAFVASIGLGLVLGSLLALLANNKRWLEVSSWFLLLPLQILPLIIFIPVLRLMQPFDDSAGALGTLWTFSNKVFPTVFVSALCCAYFTFSIVKSALSNQPALKGGLFQARHHLNVHFICHVQLPCIRRVWRQVLDVAMARVLLTVLVCENLITDVGLGAIWSEYRGEQLFAQSWAVLICMYFVAVFIRIFSTYNLIERDWR